VESDRNPTTSREPFELKADWSDADSVSTQPANQFAVTIGGRSEHGTPDGIYLTVGHITPPVLIGDPEAQMAQIKELGGKRKVAVYGHYLMTRERLDELISVLQMVAKRYDEAYGDRAMEAPG
jgi:hypothetical protein